MAQYIDKAALVAEIEKRRSKNARNKLNLAASFEDNYLLYFLDTLEVKEVDLWTELGNYIEHYRNRETGYTELGIAEHFFELGLKAQKGM